MPARPSCSCWPWARGHRTFNQVPVSRTGHALPAVNTALGRGRERADTPVAGQAGGVQEVRWHTGRPGLSWLAALFLRGRQAPVLGVALGT